MAAGRATLRARGAFSIVEVVISMVIIGTLMVASLRVVGMAATTDRLTADAARGRLLAEELLTEIVLKPYAEAGAATPLGTDSGEVAGAARTLFDDLDDYNGWTETGLRLADGTAIPGTTGWTRRASVVWVLATDPETVSAAETGVKRVHVEVRRDGRPVASLTALRTRAWPLPPHNP